jgi:hypothetical protein
MSETRPPPVGGKNPSSVVASSGQSDATSAAATLQKSMERAHWNSERVQRNALRESRRNAGEEAISDDELLEDVDDTTPPLPPQTPPPPNPPSALNSFSAALTNLTPNSICTVARLIAALTPESPKAKEPAVKVLSMKYTVESECTDGNLFSGRPLEIPQDVWQLAENKVHIPLTVLMTSSLRRILYETDSLKYKSGVLGGGSKLKLLDTTDFGSELSLPVQFWHEAWQNLFLIFKRLCDDTILRHFTVHYNHLC